MNTLVIAEHDNQTLQKSTANVIAAAKLLERPVHVLVAGANCAALADEVAGLAGVATVLLADHPCYKESLAENMAALIGEIASDYTAILAAASTFGKNILPRVAAILDNTQISDVIEILAPDIFIHPIYAGNALETVRVLDARQILTIRPTAFASVIQSGSMAPVMTVDAVHDDARVELIGREAAVSVRPELGNAEIVVSGGRGLGTKEQFKLVEELADVLKAAVGASRAAVDAGLVPNEYQVGQTGKIVAPLLYIAIGISGAIQHVAGMKDSRTIVAINRDPEAPIFQIADFGLAGDLFTIVPELIAKLGKIS